MLFNSYPFIFVFLPITLIGFFTLTKYRLIKVAIAWLASASLVFYAYWNVAYVTVLIASIVFNHQLGKFISQSKPGTRVAKVLLIAGIFVNLAWIGYYKYTGFFIQIVNHFLSINGSIPQIILPLGISFYTFTQIAYLVDAYRGETQYSKYDLITYSLFVSFFPQLIAGPILRHDELIPQFHQRRNFIFSSKNMALGLSFFSLGLMKKILIADSLSPWVSPIFDNTEAVTFIEAWVGALSYTYQLYFDFSGYSDMAIGLGWMFNIRLPVNFNSPYKATSIIDFWRRWHITLSNFLRDYLYIPLGGNRLGQTRRYVNLFITMLLGGLWHGAGWTFVVWGGLHGVYLSINHGWRKLGIFLPKQIGWMITFFAAIASWVIFRSHSLQEGVQLLQTMIGINGIALPGESQGKLSVLTQFGVQLIPWRELIYLPETAGKKTLTLAVLIGLSVAVTRLPNTQEMMQQFKPRWWWAVLMGGLMTYCLLSLNRVSEFLYFQF